MFKKSLKIDGNKLKRQLKEVVSNRLVIVGILVIFLFCLLVYRLFVLQIVEGQEHLDSFNYKVRPVVPGETFTTATANCLLTISWLIQ